MTDKIVDMSAPLSVFSAHAFDPLRQCCCNCGRGMIEVCDLHLPCSDEPKALAQAMLRESRNLQRKAEHLLSVAKNSVIVAALLCSGLATAAEHKQSNEICGDVGVPVMFAGHWMCATSFVEPPSQAHAMTFWSEGHEYNCSSSLGQGRPECREKSPAAGEPSPPNGETVK